ncbi:topoisomerase C-terminal repeat-containing protein [Hymenobacter sp. GOD-10R]|uniref:topoisomerase C-terminal repeat-containing protein n=1 Tax=Hymenobacter sp. GOD-10R TaxID=3093922 RepID=UPI002D779DD5|nr:topoisomerase C-terminal repeat-containing protein [Hymenobacter sp. GOD-10R]WRQ31624.1 topoisomerase C-terminal repeat-containing protein [Hymenobacter sp. GOD-10R]
MSEKTETKSGSEEPLVPRPVGPAVTPKKPTEINVDETRDEFIKNAQPVADALRQRGKVEEATNLEAATKIISVAVGTQQPKLGDELKGDSVSNTLKDIWEVIDKDPELRKMPQAQNLRRAGEKLDGAGLLNITVRNGLVVSFISNFADNLASAQQHVAKPVQKVEGVKESPASAARAQQPGTTAAPVAAAAPAEKPSVAQAAPVEKQQAAPEKQATTPAPEAKPAASLLPESVLQKAKALYRENQVTAQQASPMAAFTKADIPVQLLTKMGLQVEELEKSGQLQKLLSGQKTDLISSFSLRNEQGEQVPFAAKLVLRRDAAGAPSLQFDLPKHQLVIPEQILGKEITPAMKEQLTKTGVVPLTDGFQDGKGKTFSAYVAIDKEMNRVVAVRREGVTVPKELLGVTLSPEERKSIQEGRPTKVQGMTNTKNQLFDAIVQLDPIKRSVSFNDVKPHVEKQTAEETKVRRGIQM